MLHCHQPARHKDCYMLCKGEGRESCYQGYQNSLFCTHELECICITPGYSGTCSQHTDTRPHCGVPERSTNCECLLVKVPSSHISTGTQSCMHGHTHWYGSVSRFICCTFSLKSQPYTLPPSSSSLSLPAHISLDSTFLYCSSFEGTV